MLLVRYYLSASVSQSVSQSVRLNIENKLGDFMKWPRWPRWPRWPIDDLMTGSFAGDWPYGIFCYILNLNYKFEKCEVRVGCWQLVLVSISSYRVWILWQQQQSNSIQYTQNCFWFLLVGIFNAKASENSAENDTFIQWSSTCSKFAKV